MSPSSIADLGVLVLLVYVVGRILGLLRRILHWLAHPRPRPAPTATPVDMPHVHGGIAAEAAAWLASQGH
ncbi:MAG: hypothetical protein ACYCS4_11075 [Acidimicrobiales bacterium]